MADYSFPRGNADQPPEQAPLATAYWADPARVADHLSYTENDPNTVNPFIFGKTTQDQASVIPLHYDDDAHIVTLAGSRSGKGVSLVIPNLLSYQGSVICVDLKGENAAVTAGYRRDILGQDVIVLDPFSVTDFQSASFNPLSALDPDSKLLVDDVGDIAEALIVRSSGKDAHWDESAKSVIKMILLYIVLQHPEEERNLTWLREYLLNGIEAAEVDEAIDNPEGAAAAAQAAGKSSFHHLLLLLQDHPQSFISGMAKRLLEMGDNERGSVLSTVHRNTEFLDSLSIQDVIKTSDIALSQLRSTQGASLYLVLPEIRLAQQSRWLRLLITVFLHYLQTDIKIDHRSPSVLLILDEFPALGYLQVIERATGYIAGFGVKIWSILQDLSQLKDSYPRRWETFLGNAGLLTAFGNIDLTTQDYLSKRVGQCEVNRIEYSLSSGTGENKNQAGLSHIMEKPELLLGQGGSTGKNESRTANPKQVISPLLLPDEIGREFGKHSEKILVLIGGSLPIWAHRILYYDDAPYKNRAAQNPYYKN